MSKRFSLLIERVLPVLLSLFGLTLAHAQSDFSSWRKYSQAELVSETQSVAPGHSAAFGLKIKLADRWHTYWVNPGDSGTATRLKFNVERGVKIKRISFPIPERQMTGPLISFGYSREVLLPIDVEVGADVKPGETLRIGADVEWLVCADVCIPAITTLQLDVPVTRLEDVKPSQEFGLFQRTRAQLPEVQPDYPRFQGGDPVRLSLPQIPEEEEYVDFFPFRGSGVTHASPRFENGTLLFEKSNVAAKGPERVGLLVLKLKSTGALRALQFGDSGWTYGVKGETGGDAAPNLWWMLLSAFLGGLILNLMPCVFPILSIKLLGVLKLGKAHAREVRAQNLAYVGGVLVSFIAVALLLSLLRATGQLVGWGFQLQSPVFLALLAWLFFALSLNLLGFYEIDFIDSGFGDRFARAGGLSGSFFTGVLAVVVASPCTAPFMGAALGFGLSQSAPTLIAIFFMLGLGLAFPYLLFVIFPKWAGYLPKPGAWMNRLKQVMAVPMLLTFAWMLWILSQRQGPLGVGLVLFGCAALVMAFWLKARARVLAAAVAVAVMGSALFVIYRNPIARAATRVDEGPWQPFSEARLASLKGKNLLVNMTADWCLTCKVNERLVFDDASVRELLRGKDLVLLKGDWTQQNEEITRFLNGFHRVGVPFYVMYSAKHPQGVPLPEVLTVSGFTEAINQEFQ